MQIDPDPVQAAFDHAPVGLVMTRDRIIITANMRFCEMTGHPREVLIGQSFRRFYASTAEFKSVRDIGLDLLRRGEAYSDERLLTHADGHGILVRFRATTLTPEAPLSQLVMSFAPLPEAPQDHALTPRERTVVAGLTHGHTSKEIARDLGLSPRTVEDVRARLLKRFGARNTADLLVRLTGPAP